MTSDRGPVSGCFRFRLLEWIDPPQTAEAVEVPVGAIDHGGVLARMERDERVCAQVAAHSGILEQPEKGGQGALRDLDDAHVRTFHPAVDDLMGLSDGEGIHADLRVGHQPGESQHHNPGNADRFATGQSLLPPIACPGVLRAQRIVRIDEEVGVGNDHFLSATFGVSSDSSWS